MPSHELELFIVRNFLDQSVCASLIRRIDERRRPSEISDDVGIANFRTSETCDLDWRDPVVATVDSRIAELLGLPLASSEPLQGENVWEPLAAGEVIGVDARMCLRRSRLDHVALPVVA